MDAAVGPARAVRRALLQPPERPDGDVPPGLGEPEGAPPGSRCVHPHRQPATGVSRVARGRVPCPRDRRRVHAVPEARGVGAQAIRPARAGGHAGRPRGRLPRRLHVHPRRVRRPQVRGVQPDPDARPLQRRTTRALAAPPRLPLGQRLPRPRRHAHEGPALHRERAMGSSRTRRRRGTTIPTDREEAWS